MIFSPTDFLYEGLYAARIAAGIGVLSAVYLRRERRLPLAAVIAVAVAFVWLGASYSPLLNYLISLKLGLHAMQLVNTFWYCGLLTLGFFLFVLCFKARLGEYAFIFSLAGLAECGLFGFMRLFYDAGVFRLRVNTAASVSTEYILSVCYYTALYFICRAFSKSGRAGDFLRRPSMVVYFFSTVVINLILRFSLQAVYEEMYGNPSAWIINFVMGAIPLFLFVLNVFVVVEQNQKAEKTTLDVLMAERERQYAFNSQNMEAINRQAHDLKRKLRAFEFASDGDRAAAVEDITRAISVYDTAVKTENAALSALLSEKSLYCNNHGIRFSALPDGAAISFMSPVDIYNMLGNMLDNAIEAADRVKNEEKRVVAFSMRKTGSMLVVRTDNYFDGALELTDGMPHTTKTDGGIHGYGVKSIKLTAEKYNGTFEMSADGDTFAAVITLPCE